MKKGFSLIELLAVIILLGIIITLASLAVETFGKIENVMQLEYTSTVAE